MNLELPTCKASGSSPLVVRNRKDSRIGSGKGERFAITNLTKSFPQSAATLGISAQVIPWIVPSIVFVPPNADLHVVSQYCANGALTTRTHADHGLDVAVMENHRVRKTGSACDEEA